MYNTSRTGFAVALAVTVAIAIASALTTSDTTLLLGIWLITLILIGLIGFGMSPRPQTPDEEIETEKDSERINELISENNELKSAEAKKNKFFATTVEDLRDPLTSIDGHLELLRDRHLGKITKEQKDSLDAIRQELNRITRMIIEITELTNLETGIIPLKKEQISLGDIINDTTQYMQQTIELKGIKLKTDVQQNIPMITGDRDRLTRVFANILSNAIKYTSEGKISVTVQQEDDKLLVSVSDTGVGIPADAIDKVFDAYYTADATPRGTGLGLSTAKKIVELHGGQIWADSKEGRGSTFRFTVPVL